MKLFHGTLLEFGNGVLNTGLIKKNQQSFDSVTNPNFVYLSDRITSAMSYGYKKLHKEENFISLKLKLKLKLNKIHY